MRDGCRPSASPVPSYHMLPLSARHRVRPSALLSAALLIGVISPRSLAAQWAGDPSDPIVITGVRVLNGAGGATIPPDETVEIRLQIRNVSARPLAAVTVDVRTGDAARVRYISALGTTFERRQRLKVGILAPGTTVTVPFRLVAIERLMTVEGVVPVRVAFAARRHPTTAPIDLGLTIAGAPAPLVADGAAGTSPPIAPPPVALGPTDLMRGVPRSRADRPDAIAVIIGNRTYRRAPAVAYAANDAAAMRLHAERVLGIRPGNILMVEDATLSDLKGLFGDREAPTGRLRDLVKPGVSEVFVFYSGHGAPDPTANRAYLMPVDGDADRLSLTALPVDALYDNLAALGARHVTVVLDACFSGATGSGEMLIAQASPIGIRVTDPSVRFAAGGGATIVTAAEGQQLASWHPEQRHGLLTYLFLRGLQGAADGDRDGSLSVGELRQWLTDPVRGLPYEARRLHGRDQSPQVWGDPSYRLVP